ncbi:hypothetical protein [Flavobacterium sandaracinum]|uniref:Uncharacterized protein n=1 Tax=Flavobacterium sandaracinum TaxID=2541733 RepID=A0A4R5CMC6_9FLAO|nr:hypothetical protein [Flavobacterium sandaracinum]TDE01512.1 hypothetical protein E0F91_14250 [Flavobacterium sandaracinum]
MKLETIFDYKPTESEIAVTLYDSMALALRFSFDIVEKMTPKLYKKLISRNDAIWDLVCLFEIRNDKVKAKEYWDKLPKELQKLYTLQTDNENMIV